jgi:hypothetical protein
LHASPPPPQAGSVVAKTSASIKASVRRLVTAAPNRKRGRGPFE